MMNKMRINVKLLYRLFSIFVVCFIIGLIFDQGNVFKNVIKAAFIASVTVAIPYVFFKLGNKRLGMIRT